MSLRARLVPVVLVCGVQVVAAQETRAPRDEPVVIRGARVGRAVPAVSIDVDLRDLPAPAEWQPGDPIKEIPRRAHPRGPARPSRFPAGPDPLLALQPDPPEPATDDFDVPVANFDAQTFTGVNPPDTVGDVGPAHYIHATNQSGGTTIRIYDKTLPNPTLLATFTLDTLAPPGDCASGFGDPVVLYDELADRWLLSEFSNAGNRMCVYVSKTGDPTVLSGGWWFYMFTGVSFPDYPKYGVWPDAYYVSTNESDAGAYAFDRANMLNGAVARPAQRFGAPADLVFPFQALQPADHDGELAPPAGAPGIFMRHRDDEATPPATGNDFLQLWEMHVDWTTPANSTFTGPINIAVSDFSSELCGFSAFACFPQSGSGTTLDPLREVVMFRLAYRRFPTHQALVGNLVTDADGEGGGDPLERGGIRWFELRKTSGPWTLFQEGTYSPDTNARWMAGIAMDSSGNIGVGYNVSSTSMFPSLRYAGRLAGDAPGTLRAETSLVAGTAPNGSNRYGDYSSMSVDPADGCTFWFSGMYNPGTTWRTRVGAFRFDACGVPGNDGVFSDTYQAPACLSVGKSCDSVALLTGRDTIAGGAEPNQPNTIADSCPDGTAGTFHGRESIDRIVVRSFDGQELAAGKLAQVDVTVWGWSTGFGDVLELYRAADASNPTWVKFATRRPTGRGLQVLTGGYTLPAGSVQAVRARFRYRGSEGPCGTGPYDDHDDIVFAVQ
jgi:hypothetical protein